MNKTKETEAAPELMVNVVSKPALLARINRKLRHDNEHLRLRATRGTRSWSDLGDFYVLDINHNRITRVHVDPIELARELDVLKDYERAEGFKG